MTESRRYTTVAIALHWLIALTVISMVPIGWWMTEAIEDPATRNQAFQVYQLHKSFGLTVLALTIVRLAWRLLNPAPPLPAGMPGWQKLGAGATHVLFYALLVLIPLTGWIYTSTGYTDDGQRFSIPTLYFGLFEVPHLPVPEERAPQIAIGSSSAHSALVWGGIVLLVLHVGAALKHHFADKDDVLVRMLPFLRSNKAA